MDRLNQIEIYKTMLESSQANTQAWVNKYNELEKKYDQALTVIASKKIMEMQKEIEELKDELFESYRMQLKGMVVGGQLDWVRKRMLELEGE